ncbi:MAG: hypothetical protein K6T57_15270 [Thermaceae bacterium]|nr:hypothetical protein [Thermaceae bacterium]
MQKRQLTSIGLFVYATILVTSFLHVLEAFLAYSHPVQLGPLVIPGWIAGVGVALGLDMAILYFSYLSVILQGQPGALTAKRASTAAMFLVWFAVLYSMVWGHLAAGRWLEALVGVALSSFVPLTSLRIGQVLAEVSRMDARPGREEAGGVSLEPVSPAPALEERPAAGATGAALAAQMVRVETHIHTAPTESPEPSPRPYTGMDPVERGVMQALQGMGGMTLSELAEQTGLDGGKLVKACGQAVGVSRITQGGLARNGALIPGRPAHQH